MPTWRQDFQEDHGRVWTDYVSGCGRWRCEQGHSTDPEEVWALLRVEPGKKHWEASFRTLQDAKMFVEEGEASGQEQPGDD